MMKLSSHLLSTPSCLALLRQMLVSVRSSVQKSFGVQLGFSKENKAIGEEFSLPQESQATEEVW